MLSSSITPDNITSSDTQPSSPSPPPSTQHGFSVFGDTSKQRRRNAAASSETSLELDTQLNGTSTAGNYTPESPGGVELKTEASSSESWEHRRHTTSKKKKGSGSFILKLPNEVLTHMLSFLDASSLHTTSLLNRRFHALVTSPHAWRIAFARYFSQHAGVGEYPDAQRYFTRLTPKATHRSEYILRTQLLRALKRGRPHAGPAFKPNASHNSPNFSMITYNPKLHESTVTHIWADFSRNRVIAASAFTGLYSFSDPRTGYIEIEQRLHPGYGPLGLDHISHEGLGALDVSEMFGQIIGDARGNAFSFHVERTAGGPRRFGENHGVDASITAVWIAKKETVVNTSGNLILSASGSSKGVVQFQGIKSSGTMTFVLCPGIPILEIRVDDHYTRAREVLDRVWCVVINALGEVWYLKGAMPSKFRRGPNDPAPKWHCLAGTRREGAPVGFVTDEAPHEPTFEQKTQIGTWLSASPEIMEVQFSEHWGLDYFLEVDFSGQNIITGRNGVEESPNIKGFKPDLYKYSRVMSTETEQFADEKAANSKGFIIGEVLEPKPQETTNIKDEWTVMNFKIPRNGKKDKLLLTAHAIDMSYVALLGEEEDKFTDQSTPGLSSRLFAIGTSTGSVHVYNCRQPYSDTIFPPLRSIETNSPAISSIALTSLYLVHGGSDGLVQAWDPLGSTLEPIRAIHSKFSSKARRRLAQAAASVQGIGENQFAARSIFLDPDATQLRGVVALGTHVRSWSFASGDPADGSHSRRRKIGARRGSNNTNSNGGGGSGLGTPSKIRHSSKVVIKSDIVEEANLLKGEEQKTKAEDEYLLSRFGAGKGHLSEEEMLAYAQMLSEESFQRELTPSSPSHEYNNYYNNNNNAMFDHDESISLMSESPTIGSSSTTSGWPEHEESLTRYTRSHELVLDDLDHDLEMAKALQESLSLTAAGSVGGSGTSSAVGGGPSSPSPSGNREIPIKYVSKGRNKNNGRRRSGYGVLAFEGGGGSGAVSSAVLDRDIELAIQLSIEEEELRRAIELSAKGKDKE